jgi:hypothetical protein
MARAVREQLREQHPGLHLSDAEAQQVLVRRHAPIEGRDMPVDEIVSKVITARSQNLLMHLRHRLQEERSFLMFTGGGCVLLAQALQELVQASRRSQSFLFVPKELASVLNAIGGYVLAQATAQKVVAQGQEPASPSGESR